MSALLLLAAAIDACNRLLGRIATWLVPLVVLIASAVVVLRYFFQLGFPWLSESFVWLHGAIFLLAAAYVLQIEGHVRVDVFYRKFGPRGRALVNLLGVAFLLWPAMWVLAWRSLPIAERSWRMQEASPTPNGLPFLFLMKALIIVFCVLVALQGLALLIRSLAVLSGDPRWRHLLERPDEAAGAGAGAESGEGKRRADA